MDCILFLFLDVILLLILSRFPFTSMFMNVLGVSFYRFYLLFADSQHFLLL